MTDNTNSGEPKIDVQQRTKQSVVWFTILPFLIHFLRFANSLLLARILVPSDFGIIGIISVILYYSDTFCNFGFAKAIVQRKEVVQRHYDSFFTFNLLVSFAFFTVFQFNSQPIADYFEVPELASAIEVFTIALLISSVSAVPRAKLRRELEFKALAIIEAIKVFCSMAISLTLALNGYGFWSLIISMLAGKAIGLILCLSVAKILPRPYFGLKYVKELLKFGKWDFFNGQIRLFADNIDKIVIGKALGVTPLGFYDKSLGLAQMPYSQISGNIANVAFSSFSREQDNPADLAHTFNRIIVLNAMLMTPLLCGLAMVAESFVFTVLGDKWMPMVDSLILFSFSFIFASYSHPIVSMNFAADRIKHQTIISFILTIILILAIIGVVDLGVEYVVLCLLSFNIVLFLASFQLLRSHFDVRWGELYRLLLPAVLFSAIMMLVIAMSQTLIVYQHVWQEFCVSVVVGVATYLGCLLLVPLSSTRFLRNKCLKFMGLSHVKN